MLSYLQTSLYHSTSLLSPQTPRNTWSSSVVTLAPPPTRSALTITSRSFRYASPHLWNQLPHFLRQQRLDLPIPDSSSLHDHLTSRVSSSPLLSSVTPSFFISNVNTFSQGLPSIDIWHLFGLISWISGLLYGFFFVLVFSSFSYRYFLPF